MHTTGHYTIMIDDGNGSWETWAGCDHSFNRSIDAERCIDAWCDSDCADETYLGASYGIRDDRRDTRYGPGVTTYRAHSRGGKRTEV